MTGLWGREWATKFFGLIDPSKMASSSSEEDEEERKIMAEIAGFAAKDITNAEVVGECVMNKTKVKSSLRNEKNDKDQEEQGSCQLTPEFKKHIAKKLSSYLDGSIEEEACYTQEPETTSQMSGIYLFHSSRDKLFGIEEKVLQRPKYENIKRLHQYSSTSESSDDANDVSRFEEAAVSGHSIIDKASDMIRKDTTKNESIICCDKVEDTYKQDNNVKTKKKKKEHHKKVKNKHFLCKEKKKEKKKSN